MLGLIIITILLALAFDFLNGMNDAANSIATIVSTRVLSPRLAVLWAAFFNFAAAFFFGVHVAKAIGKGIVDPETVTEYIVFAALIGAVIWVYFCTHFGLPISVSHSLIGGLIGAAFAKGGYEMLMLSGGATFFKTKIFQVILFIFLAPIIGLIFGYFLMVLTYWVFKKFSPRKVDGVFRIGQLLSSAAFSLGHGSNDAQKTMGIIAVLLYSSRSVPFVRDYLYPYDEFYVPWWIILTCHAMIGLGTLLGGWRVIKTMGVGLTHLKPVGGFSAESAAALTLFGTAVAGIPVSTTHTITGAIMGVGTTRRFSAVRWGVAGNIVWAWILTIPVTALIGALTYYGVALFVK